MHDTHQRLARDQAGREQHAFATPCVRRPRASCPAFALSVRSQNAGEQAAEEDRHRSVRAAGRCRPPPRAPARGTSRLARFSQLSSAMIAAPMTAPMAIMAHGSAPPNMPLRHRRHQRRLRREQRIRMRRGRHADAVGLQQQVQHRRHDQRARRTRRSPSMTCCFHGVAPTM